MSKKTNYVLVQCVDGDAVSALQKENKRLRDRLDSVLGGLLPFSKQDQPCRKCGYASLERVVVKTDGGFSEKQSPCGPSRKFVAAVPKRLFRAAVSERMELTCSLCKAVYFERTKA